MCCRVYFYARLWNVDTRSSLRFRTVHWLLALCLKSIQKSRIYLPLFFIPSSFSLSIDALFVAQSSRIEFEANEERKVERVKVGIKYVRSKKQKKKRKKCLIAFTVHNCDPKNLQRSRRTTTACSFVACHWFHNKRTPTRKLRSIDVWRSAYTKKLHFVRRVVWNASLSVIQKYQST